VNVEPIQLRLSGWLGVVVLAWLAPQPARAEQTEAEQAEANAATETTLSERETRALKRLDAPRGASARFFGSVAAGTGFRFNNPYRLSTQLGAEATSLSLVDPYLDFAASIVYGHGLQHGASLHLGAPVTGVFQPYLTPSYVLAYRADLPVLLYGRLGTPILLSPDINIGGEVAGSVSYFLTSGIGLTGEVAFDLFYGAATLETQQSVIPVLALSWGVIVDVEFLK
jgi:hypothetical protein